MSCYAHVREPCTDDFRSTYEQTSPPTVRMSQNGCHKRSLPPRLFDHLVGDRQQLGRQVKTSRWARREWSCNRYEKTHGGDAHAGPVSFADSCDGGCARGSR